MEPLNDPELDDLLTRWQAPTAPGTLERNIRRARRGAWWKWLLTGSIRLPVPLTLAFAVAFLVICVIAVRRIPDRAAAGPSATSTFQPVKRLQPRIIRSSYENDN